MDTPTPEAYTKTCPTCEALIVKTPHASSSFAETDSYRKGLTDKLSLELFNTLCCRHVRARGMQCANPCKKVLANPWDKTVAGSPVPAERAA
jgi:hypothetical protein